MLAVINAELVLRDHYLPEAVLFVEGDNSSDAFDSPSQVFTVNRHSFEHPNRDTLFQSRLVLNLFF